MVRNWTLSKERIESLVKAKHAENWEVLERIEELLKKERGTVFKMPKKGGSVIALMSGGLDTTVVISMLLRDYGLNVYPIYFERGVRNSLKAREAVAYFQKYFSNNYPQLFHKAIQIDLTIPPKEIKEVLLSVEGKTVDKKTGRQKGIPLQPSLYAHYAFLYSKYLEEKCSVKVRTIIGGWLPNNSEWFVYESLTSLRSVMLSLCCQDQDFQWQFTSLPMEKELGYFFEKDTIVKIGKDHGIPMNKTWTCCLSKKYQCGDCTTCWTRKNAFKKACIRDTYIYLNERKVGTFGLGLGIVPKLRTLVGK
ncbi:7-cyano-7-deazaguanine synthase [Patescibacteria group bacterium]|nr:7-cyano-7-deazaguanine synthase [Patescibacteria group bacterium]